MAELEPELEDHQAPPVTLTTLQVVYYELTQKSG